MSKGVIYILTNPSFPDYIKIGYTDDLERRLRELNRSECIPFAFRAYATYEVENRLSDKIVHEMIDRINPALRAIESIDGKERIREFYAISSEDAYALLEGIAVVSGTTSKLQRIVPSQENIEDEKQAEIISRRGNFSFIDCNIPIGSTIVYINDASITAKVLNDRYIMYEGEKFSLSGLAKKLLNCDYNVAGPHYFMYENKILNDIRLEIENNN